MTANLITDIPSSVACGILCDWLNLKSLLAIDTAFCNFETRTDLLELFRSQEFVLREHAAVTNNKNLRWLYRKKIRALRIARMESMYWDLLTKYLHQFGSTVQSIELESSPNRALLLTVKDSCRELRCLHMTGISISDAHGILVCNKKLTVVHIKSMPQSNVNVGISFASVHLPQLTVFSSRNSLPVNHVLADVLRMGNLVKLELLERIDSEEFLAIAQECPQLRSLGLSSNSSIDDNVLSRIAQACPMIVNLDLENTGITDEGISEMVTHLHALRSINIKRCARLTSASLVWIYTHCAGTLHTIYLSEDATEGDHNGDPMFRPAVLSDFFRACTHIHTLSWSEFSDDIPTFRLTKAVACLIVLVLDGDAICDQNLIVVGNYCTKLSTLCLYSSKDVVFYITAEGFSAIAFGCPALRHLVLSPAPYGKEAYTPMELHPFVDLSLQLWRVLKPQLTIYNHWVESLNLNYSVFDMPV